MLDFEAALNKIQAVPAEIEQGCKKATGELVAKAHEIAIERSSGKKTLGQMRKDDHPYAKRHGSTGSFTVDETGEYPPGTINEQSGQFKGAWQAGKTGELSGSVTNDSDHAAYLISGKGSMIVRPVEEAVVHDLFPKIEGIVHDAILDALNL